MKGFVSETAMNVLVVSTSEATIATVSANIDGVNYTWQGTAKKVSSDRYNAVIGTKLALGRAMAKAANQMIRQANGLVKSIDDNARQSEQSKTKKVPNKFVISSKNKRSRYRRPRALPRANSRTPSNGSSLPVVVESAPVVTHGPIS